MHRLSWYLCTHLLISSLRTFACSVNLIEFASLSRSNWKRGKQRKTVTVTETRAACRDFLGNWNSVNDLIDTLSDKYLCLINAPPPTLSFSSFYWTSQTIECPLSNENCFKVLRKNVIWQSHSIYPVSWLIRVCATNLAQCQVQRKDTDIEVELYI